MIECIFTIDYEIYGNGTGDLRDLVYEPALRLRDLFQRKGVRFVNFVEPLEFSKIEKAGVDATSAKVREQIRELHQEGHEIALHLHPQWANARWLGDSWLLDYAEYNLCTLPTDRIAAIVDEALAWLRDVVGDSSFSPVSFRAGNWLFQPTSRAAKVLSQRGIHIDSSVFKGGRISAHGLDYRRAIPLGWTWRFQDEVTSPDRKGEFLEIPIHTEMVPSWTLLTPKRVGLQNKARSSRTSNQKRPSLWTRVRDHLRFRYPLKFDFCRMTLGEMTTMLNRVLREDERTPDMLKPIVSIGHTKDLVDLTTVEHFLDWLEQKRIQVTTLASAAARCPDFPGKSSKTAALSATS